MNLFNSYLLVLVLPALCYGITDLVENYPFNTTLKEGDYYLYWNYSNVEESIQFAVRVKTTGWIGFGISPSGQMVDSDVVIGWIGEDGTSHFDDRYARQQALPPVDPHQDWFLTESETEDGYTQLEFNRNFVTCDELDRDILAETSRVVFSWNDNKPTQNDNGDYTFERHQQRGTTSINLRGGLPNAPDIPEDTETFTVAVDNVVIPPVDTDYYCKAVRFDQSILDEKKYIVKVSPSLSANSSAYVHHMLIYICNGLEESDLGAGGNCDNNVSVRVQACLSSLLIAAWAVGGSDLIYPENIAYPFGGPDDKQFAVMQVHYNNPDLVSGVVDSSGIQLTYISTPREFDAGIMFLGHAVVPTMIVPPGSSNYTITTFCSSEVTAKSFPPDGIHIFANMLHTHLLGVGLELSVIDETNCSGQHRTEQTQIVDRNLNYDFNFQQVNHLKDTITVLPGSTILLNCYYDSTSRSETTVGGESTRQEMCLAFPVYYPRIDLSDCVSQPSYFQFNNFIENHVPNEYQELFRNLTPETPTDKFVTTLDLLEWNEEQLDGLYDSLYANGLQYAGGVIGDVYNYTLEYPPNICCAYETENKCTGTTPKPCCERSCLSAPGGVGMTCASVVVLIVGLFITLSIFF